MNKLELMVFAVGQGLSVALVERPDNYVTLIDLGANTGFTPLKYLSFKCRLRTDLLFITHPHADHINDVETALDPDFRPYGIYYQKYDWADVKKREKVELAYKVDQFQELIDVVWPGNWIWLNPCRLFTVRGLLTIMNQRDVENPGSIPVRADRRRRMDEPTAIAGH